MPTTTFRVRWFDQSRLEYNSRRFATRQPALAYADRLERKPRVYASVEAMHNGNWHRVNRPATTPITT